MPRANISSRADPSRRFASRVTPVLQGKIGSDYLSARQDRPDWAERSIGAHEPRQAAHVRSLLSRVPVAQTRRAQLFLVALTYRVAPRASFLCVRSKLMLSHARWRAIASSIPHYGVLLRASALRCPLSGALKQSCGAARRQRAVGPPPHARAHGRARSAGSRSLSGALAGALTRYGALAREHEPLALARSRATWRALRLRSQRRMCVRVHMYT